MPPNLEKLQEKMPLVFERRDNLVRIVADETANYHTAIDRLRAALDEADFEREQRKTYDKFSAKLAPVRAEVEHINSQIANILAAMRPEPIVVAR